MSQTNVSFASLAKASAEASALLLAQNRQNASVYVSGCALNIALVISPHVDFICPMPVIPPITALACNIL